MPTTAITDRIFGKRRLRQTWQPGLDRQSAVALSGAARMPVGNRDASERVGARADIRQRWIEIAPQDRRHSGELAPDLDDPVAERQAHAVGDAVIDERLEIAVGRLQHEDLNDRPTGVVPAAAEGHGAGENQGQRAGQWHAGGPVLTCTSV